MSFSRYTKLESERVQLGMAINKTNVTSGNGKSEKQRHLSFSVDTRYYCGMYIFKLITSCFNI